MPFFFCSYLLVSQARHLIVRMHVLEGENDSNDDDDDEEDEDKDEDSDDEHYDSD